MSGSTPAATATAIANLVAGIQAVTEAVRTSCADPAQAITLLAQLAGYAPSTENGSDAIGLAMDTVETAISAVCRRAALTSLAQAAADYQPSSYQDAVAIRTKVAGLIAAEMQIAGAVPDYPMYTSLLQLRAAVIADLTARGADLARVTTVRTNVPMPALAMAYRLYGDASRYDDLVARANPVSPLFMPTSFEALSS